MLKVIKFLFFSLYLYYGFFKAALFDIPNFTNAVVLIIGAYVFYQAFIIRKTRELVIPYELLSLFIFVTIALISGFFTAENKSYVVHEVVVIIKIFVIFLLFLLCYQKEAQLDYVFLSMSITSIIITVYALINGYYHPDYHKLSLGADNNSNQFAYYVLFGVIAYPITIKRILDLSIIKDSSIKRVVTYIASTLFLGVALFAILESGSRTSLFAYLVNSFVWLLIIFVKKCQIIRKAINKKQYPLVILAIAPFIALLVMILKSKTLTKLLAIFKGSELSSRDLLFFDAIGIIKEHPIFGVGIRNFQNYSSFNLNAHNTILEIIVSTGIIGGIFYFYPYISILFKILQQVRNYKSAKINIELITIVCLFVTLFITSFTMVHLYNYQAMIALGILISYLNKSSKHKIIYYKN